MTPLAVYLPSLLFTLAVELPLLIVLLRGRAPAAKALLAGLLGTGVMHPLLWYVWPQLFSDYWAYIVSGELLVLVVEAVVIQAIARPGAARALAASGIANAASYLGGALLKASGLWESVLGAS